MQETCPKHGRQEIVGSKTIGPKHDPYGADILACGCVVAAFGPHEPLIIISEPNRETNR